MRSRDLFRRIICLLVIGLLARDANFQAHAAGTTLDGLRINVGRIYLSGGPEAQDCTAFFHFEGPKVFGPGKGVYATRILSVADDTGANLLRTNSVQMANFASVDTGIFKRPSTNATFFTLEGETELFSHLPIFTNLFARSGTSLADPILAHYGIKLTFLDRKETSSTNMEIRVEDPQGKLLGLEFWHNDESKAVVSAAGSYTFDQRSKIFSYRLGEKRRNDLILVAKLAVPETLETVRFQIAKVGLPWIPLPNLEVSIDHTIRLTGVTGSYYYTPQVSFCGGPMTNAFGIYGLRIKRLLDDADQEIQPGKAFVFFRSHPSNRAWGNDVTAYFSFKTELPRKKIKLVEGEAQIYSPTERNGGLVEIEAILNQQSEAVENPVLKSNHVSLTFMGKGDFNTVSNTWRQMHYVQTVGKSKTAGLADPICLLFALKDPDSRLVDATRLDLEFRDKNGNQLFPFIFATTPGQFLCTFDEMPKTGRAKLYLATAESLQKIHFKVEDVLLP